MQVVGNGLLVAVVMLHFRIFNPALQLDKFDKQMVYVKRWVPEYGTSKYPQPIVEHATTTKRTIAIYKETLNS